MNRNLARTLAAAVALAGPFIAGCQNFRQRVDPCWPERYNRTARKEVVDAFAPQVQNGHVLDQTIWNYMFENGSDELNGYGRYKLDAAGVLRSHPLWAVFSLALTVAVALWIARPLVRKAVENFWHLHYTLVFPLFVAMREAFSAAIEGLSGETRASARGSRARSKVEWSGD